MNCRVRSWLSACVLAFAPARAQVITTVAGTDWSFPASILPAVDAPLGSVPQAAADSAGNLYISDQFNNRVMRISPDGILTVSGR